MKPARLIFTCEHGGNKVPARYRGCFQRAKKALTSHRGWDPGALQLAKYLAKSFKCPLHASETTRLLIDLNRSPENRTLFSEWTANLSASEKAEIRKSHYLPYRDRVEKDIDALIGRSRRSVRHLSIHSFTPELNGKVRDCDIGILYDPTRKSESEFARSLKKHLAWAHPHLRIRMNYPYRGRSDGFATFLRTKFPHDYAGIELEFNQALLANSARHKTLPILYQGVVWAISRAHS